MRKRQRKRWTPDEVQQLIAQCPHTPTRALSQQIGRTDRSKGDKAMKNTGVMCLVVAPSTGRHVDMGNYFEHRGQRVLVTSRDLAERYGHLVDVPIYVKKPKAENKS